MKKTFVTFSVFLAVVCCTLAFAYAGEGSVMNVASATPAIKAPAQGDVGYGVSIGTVEAQLYSESGLGLYYFSGVQYVAKTSEGTYMGFAPWTYSINNDGEEVEVKGMALVGISSTEAAVTIPDSIKVGDNIFPITYIYGTYELYHGFNSDIKTLTIPATVNCINRNYAFDRYLDSVYMLGDVPYFPYAALQVSKVYVCDKNYYASYVKCLTNSTVFPFGWEFEWVTVKVEKPGEFAETYLTQNDFDWGAAKYVKVVGNINDIDLTAMKNLSCLMKLDLSETAITHLPENFMYGRRTLVEVKLPSTLESIGNSAFSGCTALQSFDLNGITTIGRNTFEGCSSLAYINLKGIQSIGNYAFRGCNILDNIDLSTVEYIGVYAFESCTSLKEVVFGDNLQTIESYAFRYCTSLQEVVFGDNLQTINSYAFDDCKSLKEVVFGNNLKTLGVYSFRNTAVENIALPDGLTMIAACVFQNCKNLVNVELPPSITTIGGNAFWGCTSLEDVTIPATVKYIYSGAFYNTGIKNFKCYAAVPPVADGSFIGGAMDMSRTFLHVPPFSKDFYRNTEYWSDFSLMRSIDEPIDYILVDRPVTINLEEEDNAVVANNPTIDLRNYENNNYIGQLTATGEGTLSAGQLSISGRLSSRNRSSYQYMPTLINYADKMRADNVTHNISFRNYNIYTSGEWHFISLPYDVKVSDIVPGEDTYWVIRRYDSAARAAGETSSTWVSLGNDDVLEAGKGYIVSAYANDRDSIGNYIYPTLTFTSGNSVTKNNIFRSTDITVALSEYAAEFAHNRSWNFVGNPYPCYFDMHYLNEEFTAPVTVWNRTSYVAYSPVDDDLVLSPYEAFFVQCPLDATEMTFKEAGRMHSDEGKKLYKAASHTHETISAEGRNVFNFMLSGEDQDDRARIVLNPEAKAEYEVGRDASKFFAENIDNAQIFVSSDVAYSIDERPVGDGTATLGIRSGKGNECTLSLSGKYSDEWSVMLTDNETGITVDLTKEPYQFTSSDNASRFSVRFAIAGSGQTGIESIVSDFGADANVTVTSVSGVVVYEGSLSELRVSNSGLYLISDGKETRKAILK